ncbi:YdiU family protein [Gordonia sp. (in: high G+C Gram-positive bacteria)]|uniref:protein adenylyltransferase SelO n=1 Tax=Gordonia sp. (in: high G+C Gram-positive bacteria) TaxID=84139 RepID=UPI0016969C80|nr:YdiU family protein [Gordonia sp. (in: high G+C Gram-positive bacteria)]NLG47669.1 YdiU family protein [Gordonia sp. (in: high G+C Gram-positive bacteria)]
MSAAPEPPAPTSTAIAGFENTFVEALAPLTVAWQGAEVPDPMLLIVNEDLAESLGLNVAAVRSDDGVAILSGAASPADATPVATAYAGHQFGGYAPMLGDGRALLLGELIDTAGCRLDLQLKGSGPTPFSRGGDGFAVVGPMLREYLVSEAMNALGIPTTRSLAVVATGRDVHRNGAEPGAVLARVAASHLRVGTFELAVRHPDLLRPLADYAINRHYPELVDLPEDGDRNRYLAFLETVIERQAALVAQWMLVGFVHGVMNTDNTTISGETIDYGPCAFIDAYDPDAVFSSIDHGGRYRLGNQPTALKWNLARFAEALLTLISPVPDDGIAAATAALNTFDDHYERYFAAGLKAKLGLADNVTDGELLDDLLTLMHDHRADWTGTFRALGGELRGDSTALDDLLPREASASWLDRWRTALAERGVEETRIAVEMDTVNPVYIPRNHQLDDALRAATAGDLAPFHRLLDAVTHPYAPRDEWSDLVGPAPESFSSGFRTFCGT